MELSWIIHLDILTVFDADKWKFLTWAAQSALAGHHCSLGLIITST